MAILKNQARCLRTACDRCYQLKERCQRTTMAGPCDRCDRLGQVCLTIRPVLPVGRRRVRPQGVSRQPTSNISKDPMRYATSVIQSDPDLDSGERTLLMSLLSDAQTIEYPVVSPHFQSAERASLARPLPTAWPVLKDAYLAYARVLRAIQPGAAADGDEASKLRHASSAVAALRGLSITKATDAELCLKLGFALALSAYGAIGVGVRDICHYCLSVTRPFIEATALGPDTEPCIGVLVLLEIMECMVFRRAPTLRMQPQVHGVVDRHLGLCLPLLPYYYDICFISHSLTFKEDAIRTSHLLGQLKDVQAHVENWQPSHPEGFLRDFKTSEVLQILAQARVYRLAALLMTHRLQYTFGHEDGQADIWSCEVMMELDLARRISNHPVRFVALPFIIAAVETRGTAARERVLLNVNEYVDQLTPVVQKATKRFLTRVWNERDTLQNFCWLDSVHKPCVVVDAVRSTLPQRLVSI